FLWPAFNDNFLFGVEFNTVSALSVKHAQKTVLPAAERKVSHGRSHPDVHADVSGGHFIAEFSCGVAAAGKNRSRVSIRALRENRNRLIQIVRFLKRQNRAENFCM